MSECFSKNCNCYDIINTFERQVLSVQLEEWQDQFDAIKEAKLRRLERQVINLEDSNLLEEMIKEVNGPKSATRRALMRKKVSKLQQYQAQQSSIEN
jgi:hypothetical protein